jgi:dTDP-4-amino-4,6-dideoxygalactose transaminase
MEELERRAGRDELPAAVITVDLYGQCADHDQIVETCTRYDVSAIEDAAEALVATYREVPPGVLRLARGVLRRRRGGPVRGGARRAPVSGS